MKYGRFGYPVEDMFMLAHERVRYVGDAIAAIAAETNEALQAGLDAIIVELEPLAGVFDPVAALQPDAAIVGEQPWNAPDMPRGNLLTQYIVRKGEPDAVLADCAVTLDEEYSTMHQEHAYLETEARWRCRGRAGRASRCMPHAKARLLTETICAECWVCRKKMCA